MAHIPVHIVARAEELHDTVLRVEENIILVLCANEAHSDNNKKRKYRRVTYLLVTLHEASYQFVTLGRVEVRRQVGVHAELRAYCTTGAMLKVHKNERGTDDGVVRYCWVSLWEMFFGGNTFPRGT